MKLTEIDYLRNFGFIPTNNHIGKMFKSNVQNYCYLGELFYLAQWDFEKNESLVESEQWCLFARKNRVYSRLIISNELLEDQYEFRNTIGQFIKDNQL